MIHSVALIIADFLFSKDAITEEEKEVCAYGMELIISGIISVALVLIIGLITGNIWYAVIYNHGIYDDDSYKNIYRRISCRYTCGM